MVDDISLEDAPDFDLQIVDCKLVRQLELIELRRLDLLLH
jgi:hypothetical protein